VNVSETFSGVFTDLDEERQERRKWDAERVVDAQARADEVSAKLDVAINARLDADAAIEKLCNTFTDARQKQLAKKIKDDFAALKAELDEANARLSKAETDLEVTAKYLHEETIRLRETFTVQMDGTQAEIIKETAVRAEDDKTVADTFPPHFLRLRREIDEEKAMRESEVESARPRLLDLESDAVKPQETARQQIMKELEELTDALRQEKHDRINKQNSFASLLDGYSMSLKEGLGIVNRSEHLPERDTDAPRCDVTSDSPKRKPFVN